MRETSSEDDHADRFDANRDHWNDVVRRSTDIDGVYDGDDFLAGESALLPIQETELGDVDGMRLLDLQCHVGVRTLSLARMGATVTGVDIAAEAVETSRELAVEVGLAEEATFVEANVYDLPEVHDERYDVVFTNFGVLCWLPDIDRWADVVAEMLEPGGTFYMAEHHPISNALSVDAESEDRVIRVEQSYFTDEPATDGRPHKWLHGLGETLSALVAAGIELDFVHEHPFSPIERFPGMVRDDDGYWRFEDGPELPLLVTVKGRTRPRSA